MSDSNAIYDTPPKAAGIMLGKAVAVGERPSDATWFVDCWELLLSARPTLLAKRDLIREDDGDNEPSTVATNHLDLTLEINDVPTARKQIKWKITQDDNNKIKPNTGSNNVAISRKTRTCFGDIDASDAAVASLLEFNHVVDTCIAPGTQGYN